MAQKQASVAQRTNLGLYLGRSPLNVPLRGLQDGRQFRIKLGRVGNYNLGWDSFSAVNFTDPIRAIETFSIRGTEQRQIVVTDKNLFDYDRDTDTATYLNPRYVTGTVTVAAGANPLVTGAGGMLWITAGIKAGDQISFGSSSERSLSATWFPISAVNTETTLHVTGTPGAMGPGTAYTIRRTMTGGAQNVWRFATFVNPNDGTGDDLWFATNGVDYIMTWDGSATQVTQQSSLGFTAKYLAVYKNMMIYANLIQAGDFLPQQFINSDIGKPLDTSGGISEQFRAHDGTDHIVGVELLGDNLVFYSRRHVTLAQFVGDPLVFIFRQVTSNVGLLGSRLMADFGNYHEFLSDRAQYLFDGVSVAEINSHVWRDTLKTRDPVRYENSFSFFDEVNGEVLWAIALTSDAGVGDNTKGPDEAFVEHYLETTGEKVPPPFSRRSLPFLCAGLSTQLGVLTWDELTDQWQNLAFRWNDVQLFSGFPLILVGTQGGRIKSLNSLHTAEGTPIPNSYIRFGRRPLGDRRIRGLVTRIYPFATPSSGTMDVTVRLMDHADGAVERTTTNAFDLSLPEGLNCTTPYRRGRFFECQFGSTVGTPWEIEGYDVDLAGGGYR